MPVPVLWYHRSMVGNSVDAARALAGSVPVFSRHGSTRNVYLIDNVIYKVEKPKDGTGCNEAEYDNMLNLVSILPEHILFPETTLFEFNGRTVIAMEYIIGTPMSRCYCDMTGEACGIDCAPGDVCDVMDNLGMDSQGMNIVYRDETYWIIDAG